MRCATASSSRGGVPAFHSGSRSRGRTSFSRSGESMGACALHSSVARSAESASPNQHLTLLDPTLTARIRMCSRPLPILDFGHVVAVAADVQLMLDQLIAKSLLLMRREVLQTR